MVQDRTLPTYYPSVFDCTLNTQYRIVWHTDRKSYMIYRMMLITLNNLNPDFKGTPLFDVHYLETVQDSAIITVER